MTFPDMGMDRMDECEGVGIDSLRIVQGRRQ